MTPAATVAIGVIALGLAGCGAPSGGPSPMPDDVLEVAQALDDALDLPGEPDTSVADCGTFLTAPGADALPNSSGGEGAALRDGADSTVRMCRYATRTDAAEVAAFYNGPGYDPVPGRYVQCGTLLVSGIAITKENEDDVAETLGALYTDCQSSGQRTARSSTSARPPSTGSRHPARPTSAPAATSRPAPTTTTAAAPGSGFEALVGTTLAFELTTVTITDVHVSSTGGPSGTVEISADISAPEGLPMTATMVLTGSDGSTAEINLCGPRAQFDGEVNANRGSVDMPVLPGPTTWGRTTATPSAYC